METVGLVAAGLLSFALVSRRFEGTGLTAPMVFVAAGLVASGLGLIDVGGTRADGVHALEFDSEVTLQFMELTLAIVLFSDAARIRLSVLRRGAALPLRLLGIGMPLTIAAGVLTGALILTDLTFWEAAIVAAILAPTDAALGEAVVNNPRLPVRIRHTLNVEAGLNDGLSVPVLLVFIAAAGATDSLGGRDQWFQFAVEQVGYGAFVGIAVGLTGGWLIQQARRRDWIERRSYQQIAFLALPLIAFVGAVELSGNGFIAAFTAGLASRPTVHQTGEKVLALTGETGTMLNLAVFFLFGGLAASLLPHAGPEVFLYAFISLTVIRFLPVAIALAGSGLRVDSIAFIGWFGPRGLASIVLAFVAIGAGERLQAPSTIIEVMVVTVFLSVLLHGLTAAPLAKRLAKRLEDADPEAVELGDTYEHPTRGGLVRRRGNFKRR